MPHRIRLMKRSLLVIIAIIAFSCSERESPILGIWKVDSNFYKATYQIIEKEDVTKGFVLYYNDDTTIYKYEKGQPKHYFIKNLIQEDSLYIDAISGATNTEQSNKTITLKNLSKDTLEVTSYIQHKPLKEYWIRTSTH